MKHTRKVSGSIIGLMKACEHPSGKVQLLLTDCEYDVCDITSILQERFIKLQVVIKPVREGVALRVATKSAVRDLIYLVWSWQMTYHRPRED